MSRIGALVLCLWLQLGVAWAGYIEVDGMAERQLTPDSVRLTASVSKLADTPTMALEEVGKVMDQVLTVAEQHDHAARKLVAGHVTVAPEYRYDNRKAQLLGFKANRQVTMVLPIELTGEWLQQLAEMGMTEISSPHYFASGQEAFRDRLYREALADAREQAEVLTPEGQSLGPVEFIVVNAGPRPMARMASADSAGPIRPGQVTERVQLRVRFQLD
ncbi:SIMPL domain-containing protein [Ferrimonas marina]|uniref:DUF541 domain-containing protein n=1 Tax=Ferrimonas marina TaxID=299255 RepID=A0A1M5YW45_9GAMM|nr:SIMPL domain-containing protein [Ferrimonas marina]SHI16084.1 Protein of unknown function [Ferrimonas marina]